MLDRNGLRPLAVTVTARRLVAAASEAGAVPIAAAETAERRRLGPGEMLVVDTAARRRSSTTPRRRPRPSARCLDRPAMRDRRAADVPATLPDRVVPTATATAERWIAGLDAERQRLDIKTMALEAHEPLWSMGDDTPTPGARASTGRVADHLRQSFAQVTNPAIDPERERIVMDLSVELGRRSPLLGPRATRTAGRSGSARRSWPTSTGCSRCSARARGRSPPTSPRTLDATWDTAAGETGLGAASDAARVEAGAIALATIRLAT